MADVRQRAVGGVLVRGDGQAELERYLRLARAAGVSSASLATAVYSQQQHSLTETGQPFGWFSQAAAQHGGVQSRHIESYFVTVPRCV